jgi:DNA polymerase-3 subunit delta
MAARTPAKKETPAAPPIDQVPDAPLYLLHGGDEFLVATHARALVDRLCPEADQVLGLEIIEAQDTGTVAEALASLGACLQAVQTVGFFGVSKVVWLRDAALFGRARVMQSVDVKSAVESLVEEIKRGLQEGIRLVISAPSIDKRSALFRACKDRGILLEYAVPDKPHLLEKHAQARAAALFKREGMKIKDSVLDVFISKAGTDTRQIAQEVEKLRVYLGTAAEVTDGAVQEIVSPAREASSWDFEDAVGMRKAGDALRTLRQLFFQGENAVGLIIRLEARFRDLLIFRACLGRKWCRLLGRGQVEWVDSEEAAEFCKQLERDPRAYHPYRGGRLATQALNFGTRELLQATESLLEGHRKLVSTTAVPPALVLEFLILRLIMKKS